MSSEIEDHRLFNNSENEPFSTVLERRVSRRNVMRGGLGAAAASVFAGFGVTGCSDDNDVDTGGGSTTDGQPNMTDDDMSAAMALAFRAVAGQNSDRVSVPDGYSAQVLVPWGTPINASAPAFSSDLMFTPEIQANAVGMNHDGMHNFALTEDTASKDFILALNNEYINQGPLWAPQGGPSGLEDGEGGRPPAEARTEINAHGVTLIRVARDDDGQWAPASDTRYNRRITSATPCALAGPVAGSAYAITAYSSDGMTTRGTNNNCANGYTPWGTYLTCEENWPSIFKKSTGRGPDDDRLGVPTERTRYGWETAANRADDTDGEFSRFDATPRADSAAGDYRNEPRTFGYIVEIDPYTREARPVKRTALGRFRHEGCWPGKLVAGEPVVFYTGHDSRNEYIYKFVSDTPWDPADAHMIGGNYDRLAIGDKYMNSGTLYAARFNADGTGEWLALTPEAMVADGSQTLASALNLEPGDLAGVIVNTCDAADWMGATPMDRPEWGTVDPESGAVYMTLTNNSDRTAEDTQATFTDNASSVTANGAGYATAPVNAANPRADNSNGQVIRWVEPAVGATTFSWDIFVFGSIPQSGADDNLSSLTADNYFSSCDGLWYDDRGDGNGILWIETDSGSEYTNDQVLAVIPQNVTSGGNASDASIITAANQSELKRFAVGPNGCEVTGIFATPDKSALFINIQHPANWPAGTDATRDTEGQIRPRASTVVIQKTDGGAIAV
ncbi:alkaline phosphatase PhoX [uncultured Salinisphaera sp.]|uniref:PhoX family protein n=1 Tax=uncultured Salinisphaera sp. TaxID=359372 RepID=UPI0032B23C40|tara:strand:- start:5404 stop:7596 length:2193 start_codon:yes stop_codon:yes gene_type:complete